MTFLLSQLRRRNQLPKGASGVLGDVFSADEASRGVELAFINRYTRRTVKASEIALKLASADLSKQDQLEASTMASFALMQSASYGKIARELEREVPEDLGFGRFKGKK